MTAWIVVPAFNCGRFIAGCLASIQAQDYPDMRVVIIDDASTDGRQRDLIRSAGQLPGWDAHLNDQNCGATANIHWASHVWTGDNPDDVIIIVDGDDRLCTRHAVSKIMAEYENPDCWMTYGSYVPSPPDPDCPVVEPYPREVIDARAFREWSTLFNHPITFRRFLFDALDPADLQTPGGEWIPYIYDEAICYPMLELAGDRHRFLSDILYVYTSNNPESCNVDPVKAERMREVGTELRARPPKPLMVRENGIVSFVYDDGMATDTNANA